uniref:Uncharacterized mitochondrial protein AtMg00810-like n=1 Tax=Nicotiana tabacum TaxID=4097 RepID=A0A1S4C5D9_TOBAC|nr:PREDICTED: uncharacterized mitochondrial protein AtMg00810-like [Nicotiana tabacum]
MKQEIQALLDNNTWFLVDLPAGKRAIRCKWVVKYNARGGGGGRESHYDYSLFTKKVNGHIRIILMYVDDILIIGSSASLIQEDTKALLQHHFKIKDLGEMKYFRGLEIARSKAEIYVCQRKFALDLISDLGLAGSKHASTPLEVNQRLTSMAYDKGLAVDTTEIDEAIEDATSYQKLVGKLLYLTMTRPDIAYAIQNLS